MFPTLIRRVGKEARSPSQAYMRQMGEAHPPKKVWPPDFKRLSVQEQLKFEKKFKRRLALAMKRPQRDKVIQLVQLFSITSVVIYGVLFMDWKTEQHPFVGVRKSLWGLFGYDYEVSSTKPIEKIIPRDPPQVN